MTHPEAARGMSISGPPGDRITMSQEGSGYLRRDQRIRIASRKAALSRRHQAVGLVRREVTSRVGPNSLLLEAPDGCAGQ